MPHIDFDLEIRSPRTADPRGVSAFLRRFAEDASIGTFDDFRGLERYGVNLTAIEAVHLASIDEQTVRIEELGADGDEMRRRVHCTLHVPPANLNLSAGGIGFLLGTIAGDILGTTYERHRIVSARIVDVRLPDEMVQQLGGPNVGMERVREILGLPVGFPLLAFSVKPRIGLTPTQLEEITRDVGNGGVLVIEDDTQLGDPAAASAVDRAAAAYRGVARARDSTGKRIVYSPNLTGAGANVVEAFSRIDRAVHDAVGLSLEMVKLDVLPSGFPALEALRRHIAALGREVIITVYPSMYTLFERVIDRRVLLALSRAAGADILYPGRPVILAPRERQIDAGELDRVLLQYHNVLLRDWAGIKRTMPTVAAGIKPTDIRLNYEFVGPYVGFFIGGGIASAPGGPRKGAEFCVRAAECAVQGTDFRDREGLRLQDLESIDWKMPDIAAILRDDRDLERYRWINRRGKHGLPG